MTLPEGLAFRPEFAPQHAGKSEKPSAGTNTAAPAGAGTGTGTEQATTQGQGTAASRGQQGAPCGMESIWMILAMFALMYFLLIRPGQKQEKQQKEMRSGLRAGDRVVTGSGMHGTIVKVDEHAHTVTLQADDEGRVRMTFDTTAITRKVQDDAGIGDKPQ